jgi:hypothetical protein
MHELNNARNCNERVQAHKGESKVSVDLFIPSGSVSIRKNTCTDRLRSYRPPEDETFRGHTLNSESLHVRVALVFVCVRAPQP